MAECSISGCSHTVNARGMCPTHYGRWRKTGSAECECLGCGKVVADGRTRWCSPACKPPCIFDGCTKRAYSREGLCARHARMKHETGELRPLKWEWAASGRKCLVCNTQIPQGKRWRYCSDGCKVRASVHRRRGVERPKVVACAGCGSDIDTTLRRTDGTLRRSDIKWCDQCDTDTGARRRMRRYNVTPSQYAAALARGCEVCGRLGVELHIDHDHACCPGNYTCGKCVRGYLCGSCNRMLGLASDDVTTVLAAANYLMRSRDVLACAPTLTDRKE